jgi:hypothetical protein
MFEKISIFPTMVYRTKVDPDSYDKKELIKTITENHKKKPIRNNWGDRNANLHHYYDDWNNPIFKSLNTEKINAQYKLCVDSFMQSFTFKQDITYKWDIANFTACKNSQFMVEHDHLSPKAFYSAVHYLKLKKYQNPTRYINPLLYSLYDKTILNYINILPGDLLEYSSFYKDWAFSVEEDDLVFFPSYLRHKFLGNSEPDSLKDLRITGAINIYIDNL